MYHELLRLFASKLTNICGFPLESFCLTTTAQKHKIHRVLLDKVIVFQPYKKFPAFSATQSFITVLRGAGHFFLIQSRINPLHILSSYFFKIVLISAPLHLGLTSYLFPLGLFTETLCTFLFSSRRATRLAHFFDLDLFTLVMID